MQSIGPPDSHCLLAAAGWLELGCASDALAELNSLSAKSLRHPDALEMRWLIQADLKDWRAALETAVQLVEIAPNRPAGWLHRAYALRRVPQGGLQSAWDCLLPAHKMFPKEPVISYNLSCYACQMGRLDDGRSWLKLALQAGAKDAIKQMALKDEDLRTLWDEIRTM